MVKGGPMIIDYTLRHGSHESPQHGLCAMEWVAYLAGEKHSDYPSCVDLALRGFAIGLNDNLPDDLRQQLRPYLVRMIGTADDGRSEERRYAVADWAIHVPAAQAQVRVGRNDLAEKLRAIPEVRDVISALEAGRVARGVAHPHAHADAAAHAAVAAAHAAVAAGIARAARAASDAAKAAAAAARLEGWDGVLPLALEQLDRLLPTEAIELPESTLHEYERLMQDAAGH
jgi:hypothetical protein